MNHGEKWWMMTKSAAILKSSTECWLFPRNGTCNAFRQNRRTMWDLTVLFLKALGGETKAEDH